MSRVAAFRWVTVAIVLAFALSLTGVDARARLVNRDLKITDQGTTLNVVGSVTGLGNGDLTVILDTVGTATITCTNPGGNVAPGLSTEVTPSGQVSGLEVKNGRAFFDVTTIEPEAPDSACPNDKFTPSITDVQFTDATLTFIQNGVVVLGPVDIL